MVRRVGPWSLLSVCLFLPVAARAADPAPGQAGPQGDQAPARSESLTPQQARDLVAAAEGATLDGRHLKTLDAETAAVLAASRFQSLALSGLTTIDTATAGALAEFQGRWLELDGLTRIDAATAEALAGFKGDVLRLGGLTRLDAGSASSLARFKGEHMQLNGLAALPDEAAAALAESTARTLVVPKVIGAVGAGLRLTPATARLVVVHTRAFPGARLANVKACTGRDAAEIAQILARCQGPLSLPALERISPDALAALIKKRDIEIPPIERLKLTPEPDRRPGENRGIVADVARLQRLRAPRGIESLTPQSARDLVVEHAGRELTLSRLVALDAETAVALAAFKGQELALPGLTKLDAATAKTLAAFGGEWLRLDGLTALDPATAAALAGFKLRPAAARAPGPVRRAHLCLSGLTTLDAATARALAGFEGDVLVLPGVTAIDASTAESLAAFTGELSLDGVKAIDAATAEALAKFAGQALSLDGLAALDTATAEALAKFAGQELSLDGVTALEAVTAEALAEFKGGGLSMARMRGAIGDGIPLTPAMTRLVCTLGKQRRPDRAADGMAGGGLRLDRVVALDRPDAVEVARILAAHEGPLSLPNLRKVSPKTLSALIEKPDLVIPLIEKLELIPEPDGSPNDDFVIPADLEERQRRQGPQSR